MNRKAQPPVTSLPPAALTTLISAAQRKNRPDGEIVWGRDRPGRPLNPRGLGAHTITLRQSVAAHNVCLSRIDDGLGLSPGKAMNRKLVVHGSDQPEKARKP